MMLDRQQRLRGKTVVVTGASSGIGAEAARRFAELGATVAVVGRSPEKTEAVARRVGGRPYLVDFGRLGDVRSLAAQLLADHDHIDILANNAGGMFATRTVSPDGREMTFQVNHLAPFLLTNLLLPSLTRAPDGARVTNTASSTYRRGRLDLDDLDGTRIRYRSQPAYAASKLATVLFTQELARRTRGTGVTTSCFHPGIVATDIGRDSALTRLVMNSPLSRVVLSTPQQAAEPLLHLATIADPQAVNGAYFNRLTPKELAPGQARDPDLARHLWDRSAQLTGLQPSPSTAGETPAEHTRPSNITTRSEPPQITTPHVSTIPAPLVQDEPREVADGIFVIPARATRRCRMPAPPSVTVPPP